MIFLEGLFLWSGITIYLVAFLCFLYGLLFRSERFLTFGWFGAVGGFVLHNLSIAVRWVASGHPPLFMPYEHFLALSWFVAVTYIATSVKSPTLRKLGVGVLPLSVMLLGIGMMSEGVEHQPLPPPYRSLWLWVHAVSWFGYASFFAAAIYSVLFLVKERTQSTTLPSAEEFDRITFAMIVFGFITLAAGTGAGALYAYGLWGRYWAWDPIETWALITWLIYGLNIHLRVIYGLSGVSAAWLAIVSLVAAIITIGGLGFVGGIHTTLL